MNIIISSCNYTIAHAIDICQLDFVSSIASLCGILLLIFGITYLLVKYKQRFDELLIFHNIRSVAYIILLLANICEIAESTLSLYPPDGFATSYFQLSQSWLTLICFTLLIILTRIIEILRKEGWLILLAIIEAVFIIIKICKILRLMDNQELHIINLQPFLITCSLICLICLLLFDSYTIYRKINSLKQRRTSSQKDKIGYKHTQSTFLSKITFWWITPLLWHGFHQPLELEDLGCLSEDDSSRSHYDQFLIIYQSLRNKKMSLWMCYFKSSWKMFAYGGLLKLCGDLTALVGPLSITQIVGYIENANSSIILQSTNNFSDINNNASTNIDSVVDNNNNITEMVNLLMPTETKYLINEKNQIYYPTWSDFIGNGWIMGIIVLIASLAQGSFSQASTHIVNMVGIRLRTSIQGLIYRKTLLITSSCYFRSNKIDRNNMIMENRKSPPMSDKKKQHMSGFDAGTITNLMSEDVLNVMSFFWIAHYVWAIPLKIVVVMYFLYKMLGISAIIGAVVCVFVMIPLQFLIGKAMSNNSKIATKYTDERLKRINEILLGMKIIKLNAWERVFKEKIQDSRNKELQYLKRDSVYWTLMTFLTHVSSVLITFVTLAVFINMEGGDGAEFTASRVFAALALFNQMTVPLFIFPITVPIIISAIVSTKRLMNFFDQPEVHRDFEGVKNMARILSRSDASLDVYEKDDFDYPNESEESSLTFFECDEKIKSATIDFRSSDTSSIENIPIRKLRLTKTKLKKNNEISMMTKVEKNRNRQKTLSKELQIHISPDLVVKIVDGVFTWENSDNNFLLNIKRLDIAKGKLNTIVGKSGSGKTSLLAALLGEMLTMSGNITWNKYSTIAYVPQNPWLLNASIRDNILFGESFRPKRYQKVLELCALMPDIELMPCRDNAEIGERGINLSGGQRQRISIARALYSSANVVIMDDPMSSLDNEVARTIFDNAIKKMLIKHNRTVIMVTQKINLLYSSDKIIAMENNSIRTCGTYSEIEINDANLVQEWNALLTSEDNKDKQELSPGRTARERWKLFRNVSKIGLQRSNAQDGENLSASQSLYIPKIRNCLYGSRHLTYDMPFPIDECNIEGIEYSRRQSKRDKYPNSSDNEYPHKDAFKTNSLEIDNVSSSNKKYRLPVSRNVSSPTTLQYFRNRSSNSSISTKNVGFRQFLNRMSFRNLNGPATVYRPTQLTSPHSTRMVPSENHSPVQRIISTISQCSKETEDEICSTDFSEKISNRLIYDEERKYGKIPTRIYMLYLKSCGLYVVFIFCLSAFGWQALRMYTDVWLRGWTDIDYSICTSSNIEVFYYFRIFALLSVVCVAISMISTPAGQIAGYRACKILHERFLNAIMKKSLNYFQTTPHGRIMNRFSSDITVIDKKIATTSQRLLQFVLLCLSAVLINTAITPWFMVLTIPICGAYYMVQLFYRSSSRELQRIESITSSPVISHFSESIHGVTSIRAYNQESRFMEMLFKRIEANNVAFIMLNTSNRWLGIALDYLGGVIVFVAIDTALFTSYMYPETTTPSLVGLAINYTLLVPIYLNWVVKLLSDMEMYIGAVERIAYSIESENSNGCEKNFVAVPISWPHKGNISFDNVSIRYENQQQNVISNLSLTIEAGKRIGICGRTGSGKSTLAMALFRCVDLSGGKILIDDIDISTIHTDEIRTRLSIIPQEVTLFSGTLRENLDPRGHYTDLELWNSIELAQLKDIITSLPDQLDTNISDNSAIFSAGQKQLFSLARAVLRGSVCLVLDEVTSSLDSETESALLNAADKAFQGRTIITIAHRLTSILDYDHIICLENGHIVEEGNPRELKVKPNSKFSAMLNSSSHHDT